MTWLDLLYEYRIPIATVFITMLTGLMVSAHSQEGAQGRFVNVSGVLFAMTGIFQIAATNSVGRYTENRIFLYGIPLAWQDLFAVSALVFGVWAFFSSMWRVGDELLERRRFWRLPLFLLFFCSYVLAIRAPQGTHDLSQRLVAWSMVGGVTFLAALLRPERSDYWRRWLSRRGKPGWLDEAPVWLTGYTTAAFLALLLGGLSLREKQVCWTLPLALCYLGRDLFFLQWCRFTRSRRPTMMALLYIGLAYSIPPMILAPFNLSRQIFLYGPIPDQHFAFLVNLMPGLAQAALMGAVMLKRLERQPSASLAIGD